MSDRYTFLANCWVTVLVPLILSAAKDTVFYCAHQSDIVEAAVFPELLVFDGNDGIDHVFRNLIIFQNGSVSFGEIEVFNFVSF